MDFIYKIYDIARVSHDLAAVLALWIAPLRYLLLAKKLVRNLALKHECWDCHQTPEPTKEKLIQSGLVVAKLR